MNHEGSSKHEAHEDIPGRGIEIPGQRVDLIVGGAVVVELKTVVRLDRVHTGQLISYLKTTGLRGGLLINFRVPLLVKGLKRIVL